MGLEVHKLVLQGGWELDELCLVLLIGEWDEVINRSDNGLRGVEHDATGYVN